MLRDLLLAARTLRRSPKFAAVSIIALALGVGANAALFSVADAVLLRPLPLADAGRLVIAGENVIEPRSEITYRDFDAWHAAATMFDDMAAIGSSNWSWRLRTADEQVEVRYRAVSGHLFDLMGAPPALVGRTLNADDDRRGATRVVVLSHGFWQRQYGGDPRVVGRSVTLNDTSFAIVGVMPRAVAFPSGADMWTPLVPELAAIAAGNPALTIDAEDIGVLFMVGRLKPHTTVTAAQRDLNRINADRTRAGARNRGIESRVLPITDEILGPARVRLLSLVFAAALLLLVACANVAALMLVRASSRGREFAVRLALGASPAALVRHLLGEAIWLSSAATSAALASAYALVPGLVALLPADVPRIAEAAVNGRAIAFTCVIGAITAIVSSLVPAFRMARAELEPILRNSAQTVTSSGLRQPLRRAFVVAEMAATVVLITAVGLLTRSVVQLRQVDIGFNPVSLLALEMSLPSERMRPADERAFLETATRAIAALPGVASVARVSLHPLQGPIGLDSPYELEGQSAADARRNPYANIETIAPAYFTTMQTPMVAGRAFTDDDRVGTQPVIVVSQRFARQTWPGHNPLGKRLRVAALDRSGESARPLWTVVGVAGDIRYRTLASAGITIYAPAAQSPDSAREFMVRTSTPATIVVPAIRSRLRALNGNGIVTTVVMADMLRAIEAPWYANLILFAAFAMFSVLLAILGLYAMLAYSVAMQRREIGLRLVLGATPARVARDVMTDGARAILTGAVIGVAAAAALMRLMASILFEVRPADPLTLAAAPLLFSALAAIACAVPAVRAARTEPAICLREE